MVDDIKLKYRPTTLDEIVGHSTAVKSIKNYFKKGNIPHAFLFVGNPGTGKTTMARIIANMLNCTETNIIEIDGAALRGVDDYDKILESLVYKAWGDNPLKVVIVDECLGQNSRVNTEHGYMYIRDIVNKKLPIKVYSYNSEKCTIELKPITGWFRNSGKQIYATKFESTGTVYSSNNHVFITPNGEKKLSELKIGSEVYRKGIILNDYQKQFIYGSLLGDASLSRSGIQGNKNNSKFGGSKVRFKFIHGQKQKEYLEYKYSVLKDFVKTPIKYFTNKGWPNYKESSLCTFSTLSHQSFINIYNTTTINNKKTVTTDWVSKLDWAGIAIWFCDDGSLAKKGRSCTISTNGFTLDEVLLLQNLLKSKGVFANIKKDIKTGYYLYISKEDCTTFINNITPFVPKSMAYKVYDKEGCGSALKEINNSATIGLYIDNVVSIVSKKYEGVTFDIEVQDNHNYFVGNTLVHNCQEISSAAWSRLLKTIEEPPEHLYFILCTTNGVKVPKAFDKQRLQTYNLKDVSLEVLEEFIYTIWTKETSEDSLTDKMILAIAENANGSPRKALNLISQCIGLTEVEVLELLETSVDEDDGDAITLAKLFIYNKDNYTKAFSILKNLKEKKTNPESIRIIVCNYISACVLGAKNERDAARFLGILDKFSKPVSSYNGFPDLVLMTGNVILGE